MYTLMNNVSQTCKISLLNKFEWKRKEERRFGYILCDVFVEVLLKFQVFVRCINN